MPMALFAPNGRCIETNEAYAEMIGTTRDIVLTMNYKESESWRVSGLLEDCLAVVEANRPRRREAQITTTFGKNIWFDCQMIPIKLNGETHILVKVIDLTERKRLEAELRHLSFHDALTQLPNRRLLLDRLKHAMQLSRRHNSHFALLFLDLNKFKQLNDTHGHEVGDHMLIEVARRLPLVVRDTDTVARLGGDEFVVLLEDLGAERLRPTITLQQSSRKSYIP
ncbi:MAG: diguanylate cyclase [Rhodocyclaceae bacterium]|nr:diguanylate cyclase [Rhodocyclaceae bacterium]